MTKQNQKLILDVVSYTLLILGAVLMVGPFLWMVSTSFKLPGDQFTKTLIPPTFTLENFRELFSVDLNFPLLSFGTAPISRS
jgi:ABC-type glycerol-3-phosphate transport system permease component